MLDVLLSSVRENIDRPARLCEEAAQLQRMIKATWLQCTESRSRRSKERSQQRVLVPPDYSLPPLHLIRELTRPAEQPPPGTVDVQTTVFVWGSGRPGRPLTAHAFRFTEEAARFAAERGWDEDALASWVVQLDLPGVPLNEALQRLARGLDADPSVRGWGMRSEWP
jgi:hypothetical protein